jgi:hypothetical protein
MKAVPVSRALWAVWDEGRPLGIAVQAETPNHLKVLSREISMVLSVKEKAESNLSDGCMEDERK